MKIAFLLLLSTLSLAEVKISLSADSDILAQKYKGILNDIYFAVTGKMPSIYIYPSLRETKEFGESNVSAMGARIKEIDIDSPNAIRLDPPIIDKFVIGIWSIRIKHRVDFNKSTFVGVRGNEFVDYIVKKYKIKNIVYTRSNKNLQEIIKNNRADFVILDEVTLKFNPLFTKFKLYTSVKHTTSVHHFISRDIAHFKNRIEAEISKRKKEGLFELKNLIGPQKIN